MKFRYSISKNHYNGYKLKESNNISELLEDLATCCVSPVTVYTDKEVTNIIDGKSWISKNHRTNGTIKERGNLGMIDFEGKPEKLKQLFSQLDKRDLFYVAIPSQSNKSDKKNSRYHVMYLLSEPFSINAEAMKKQAKEFFDYIDYKWDDPESGIDTRASFNGCGYFSPTIPLRDAKSRDNKKISEPYITFDDIAKDTYMSRFKQAYVPTAPESVLPNEEFNMTTVRGKRIKDIKTRIVRTTKKGYVLSSDTHIMTGSIDRFVTFEGLVEKLADVQGDNPRISGLGCPICNEGHTELKPGYAYMQYDEDGTPYICCTGNACVERPYFTMAEGNISVYRTDDINGVVKYVMFEDDNIIYTHDRDMSYKMSPEAVADTLYNRGLGVKDENGRYSRGITINEYCVGAEAIQINQDPFTKEGLDIVAKTFNISPPARFEPTPEEPNAVIAKAIKAFEDDNIICGYPVSLVYLSYYMFHYKQIMAVLFLVNPDRGSGKSFWVLDLPTWYLGATKVAGMGSAAIIAGWDDDKLGSRLVVYEDVEELNSRELGLLRSEIKSDATAGNTKMLNIKGQGKKRSFGFNSAGTSNHYDQVPFDGSGDRRIYPSPYKMVANTQWLAGQLRAGSVKEVENRTNAVNFLYKIYKECEASDSTELQEALYYKVPKSIIRSVIEDSTSTDGNAAMNIIRRATSWRSAYNQLTNIVASDVKENELKNLLKTIEWKDGEIRVPVVFLNDLWNLLPTGRNNLKAVSGRRLLSIFNIDKQIKALRIHGKVVKGFIL